MEPGPENLLEAPRVALPQRFEKTRLAVLTYSAAAILLAFADRSPTSPLPGISGIEIDIHVLRVLAIIVATVYMVVFLFYDIPAARGINRELLRGKTWSTLDDRLKEIADQVTWEHSSGQKTYREAQLLSESIDEQLIEWQKTINYFDKTLRTVVSRQLISISDMADDQPKVVKIANNTKFAIDQVRRELSNDLRYLNVAIKEINRYLSEFPPMSEKKLTIAILNFGKKIDSMRQDLTKLNKSLTRLERSRFIIWEVMAPLVVWIISAIMSFLLIFGYVDKF